jgi:predicted acylesterase/phospholipase RssA
MDQPLRIQLALQGGGAKIYGLLAALEVVEKMQRDELLQVTRVAGTSAGALAGTLFAAGVPMTDVINFFLGEQGRRLIQSFQLPGKLKLGWKIVNGIPFWSTKPLEKIFDDFLRPNGIETFSDIKKKTGIDVIVTAADLGDSTRLQSQAGDLVIPFLMDSAGLPFCFRTWSKGGAAVRVDGGICENLPIGNLKKDVATEGRIIVFTFPFLRPGAPEGLKSFAGSLLDTAMNNSMKRAKEGLSENSVFEIPTELKTFEFEKALQQGRGSEFKLIQERVEKFLKDFATTAEKQNEVIQDAPWTEKNFVAVSMMDSLGKVYKTQHSESKFEYIECRFAVTIKKMLPKDDVHHDEPDIITYSSKFRAVDQPIYCLSNAISQPPDLKNYLARTHWEVRDEGRNVVGSTSIPSRNPDRPSDWELVHFLDRVIHPGDGVFSLRFLDEAYNFMQPLIEKGEDELLLFPRRARGQVGKIELIVHVPKQFTGVTMKAKKGDNQGRLMTEADLFDTPPGFRSIGWVGENVEASSGFGVDILSPYRFANEKAPH